MAAGPILTILANIPWGQVVENAPRVADGAAKLWTTVNGFRRKKASDDVAEAPAGESAPSEADLLRTRVATLEEAVKDLSDQMQASSELIKALAEQNTQLIQRIELNRMRLQRLGIAVAVAVPVLVALIAWSASRA